MLHLLVLGVCLAVGLGLVGYWLLNAEPARIRRILKWALILGGAGAIIAFAARGNIHFLWSALLLGLPFLLRGRMLRQQLRNAAKTAAGPSPGNASTVRTDWLEMMLDHDSGAITGTVIKGAHSGSRLEAMSLEQLLSLWEECRGDQESNRLLETYLDRAHDPEHWREQVNSRGSGAQPGTDQMTREQALHVLGLNDRATDEEVREAHRRLMLANHPDRGGSTFIAAQINRAKETLLGV